MTFVFRSRRDLSRIRASVRASESASRNRSASGVGLTKSAAVSALRDTDRILVKNSGTINAPLFGVLGLDDPLVLPASGLREFQDAFGFEASEPVYSTHLGKFAICEEPIPVGESGVAVVSGITKCRVEILSASHEFADVHDGQTTSSTTTTTTSSASVTTVDRLMSADTGSAQILWKGSVDGDGLTWCVVRLSNVGSAAATTPGNTLIGKVFKVTNAGGTGTNARVVTGTTYTLSVGGVTAGSSVTLTQDETDVAAIHYKSTAIAAGMYFVILYIDGDSSLPVLDNRSAFLENL